MLLWVDSCFRPGGEETLAALSCSGFSVMRRFKKPERLQAWLDRSVSPDMSESMRSLTVVTSWKEAKATVASLSPHLTRLSVDLVLVTCADGARAFELAVKWAESLSAELASRVLVCKEVRDLHSCLVLWRCRKLLQNMQSL